MLVAYKPLLGKRKVTVAIFTPHGWKFPLGRFHSALSERVTHWQPFPEPPGKA